MIVYGARGLAWRYNGLIVYGGRNTGTPTPPPVTAVQVPLPHRIRYVLVTTELAWRSTEGGIVSSPLIFTAGETGPIVLQLLGSDGSTPDLTTAQSVTFSLQNQAGTLVVNAVSLSNPTSDGQGTWSRTALQTATPGDYIGQAKVVDSGGDTSYYPDALSLSGFSGSAVTMLRPVGG